ncbi:transglutaminase family protein [Cognataquiflexum aquatile]|uniref:transglutaminase family protein n=1 Tax=Cognataquiflexum aquatile TaxID=2249427 RepID=UPI000DE880C4|nr:transglutaminase family protein [Cognataquiflexum aquatile]
MKLRIRHSTRYTYDKKVQLNIHEFYLIPLQRFYFKVLKSNWTVFPTPLGFHERINFENNPYFQAWFTGESDFLEIKSDFEIEVGEFNPYGFIIQPQPVFPFETFSYPEEVKDYLRIYIEGEKLPGLDDFVKSVMKESDGLVGFLVLLLAKIHSNWEHIIRHEEGIMPLGEVFESKIGSCRDLSWMLMAMLRSIGLACRFVSGYAFNPELDAGHELHAWVEVFLPGASWIGLDPSLGLLADSRYIPLAISYDPKFASPVVGNYGGASQSHLTTDVVIEVV